MAELLPQDKYAVVWETANEPVNGIKASATFLNENRVICRVLQSPKEIMLYPVSLEEIGDLSAFDVAGAKCIMKYHIPNKTLTFFDEKGEQSCKFPYKSTHPFVMEININNRTITFTEPKLHYNDKMLYESRSDTKLLSRHYKDDSTFLLDINKDVLSIISKSGTQMTKEQLETLIFLMCVVTKAVRRNSALGYLLIGIITLVFGALAFGLGFWIKKLQREWRNS